jgi:hypothetical protein
MEAKQVKKKSNEFFTMVNGEKSDAALHESILAGGPDTPHPTGIAQARRIGLTEKEIQILYLDDPNFAEDMAAGKILSGADVNAAMQAIKADSPTDDAKNPESDPDASS